MRNIKIMKVLYFDMMSGVSGDMILGALIDLGFPVRELESLVKKLKLGQIKTNRRRVVRGAISSVKCNVNVKAKHAHSHHHRSLSTITSMIKNAGLSRRVSEQSGSIFTRLARAEAKIHNTSVQKIHFHEVGAVDAIIDIVGSCLGFEFLGIEGFYASPFTFGSGTTSCAHGILPVPVPATVELTRGFPSIQTTIKSELVTPTGAAIVTTLVKPGSEMPALSCHKTGYGAGSRIISGTPNVLRLRIGETHGNAGEVDVLECHIDDDTPECLAFALEKVLEGGALDSCFTPVTMKKSRPGVKLTVICEPDKREKIVRIILENTSTLGVRFYRAQRECLVRRNGRVKTPWGMVTAKIAVRPHGEEILPEFDICENIARKHKVPIRQVYDTVRRSSVIK
jgi:uncharacterized protein (TIGR00299 family) protein